MTVSYSADVAHRKLGMFGRLLFRWRGSIWKLMYREMIMYWICYFLLFALYKMGMNEPEKIGFENVCRFFAKFIDLLPMTFILGFYVSMVVQRWWQIYQSLAWPDSVVMKMLVYIPCIDDGSRLIRRTLVRWMSLANVLVLRSCSAAARARFPTLEEIKVAGFMTEDEMHELDKRDYASHHYWVPIKWCMGLLNRARLEGKIPNNRFLIEMVNEMNVYRCSVATVLDYDWISIPLVYTQVITVAAYSFYFATLFARQPIDRHDFSAVLIDNDPTQLIYPIVSTTIQLMFYMGWLKVAETLINPLGLDDDDFEVNWLITRHLKHCYLVVDDMFGQLPVLEKDLFWDKENIVLPMTKAAVGVKDAAPKSSQAGVKVEGEQAEMVIPDEKEHEKQGFLGKIADTLGNKFGIKSGADEKAVAVADQLETVVATSASKRFAESAPPSIKKSITSSTSKPVDVEMGAAKAAETTAAPEPVVLLAPESHVDASAVKPAVTHEEANVAASLGDIIMPSPSQQAAVTPGTSTPTSSSVSDLNITSDNS